MGRLLIVDDEPDILETLEELFKYESGLDIDVYVAKSAKIAVELLEQSKFDVVMTDIKMPGMSGIELFHLIKENWPKCRVIFLTGYRDFDDLYEIMGNKDVRYLLKSESYDVLVKNVTEAFQEIEEMLKSEIQENQHQKDLKQAQLVLRKNYLKDILDGNNSELCEKSKLEQVGVFLIPEEPLFIFLGKDDGYIKGIPFEEQIKKENIINEIVEEFLPVKMRQCIYYGGKGYYLFLFQPDHVIKDIIPARMWKRLYANLEGAVEYIQEKMFESADISMSFVTCDERCFLKDGKNYGNRLKQEALGRIGNGVQRIIMAKAELPETTLEKVPINFQLQLKQLEQLLENKKYLEFLEEFRKMTQIISNGNKEQPQIAEIYYGIVMLLLRYININHLKDRIQEEVSAELLLDLEKHTNEREAAAYLNQAAICVVQELEAEGRSRTSEVIEKIVLFIEKHLAEDLTLTRLADICYLNPSYLSRVFKQTYGCNLTEYIVGKRMEQARTLLAETQKKIQDVALEVGYLSVPSFNRVFKKENGISPLEYRKTYGVKNYEI